MVQSTQGNRIRRHKCDAALPPPSPAPRAPNTVHGPSPPIATVIELVRTLTHEINQPLASILSNAQAAQHLLNAGRVDRSEIHAILRDVTSQNKRISETLQELKTLLKHCDTPLRSVRLSEVLREALAASRSDLLARRIYVRTQLASSTPPVRAASLQIRQVLLALVQGICDVICPDRSALHQVIEIRTAVAGKVVRVSIEGEGRASAADPAGRVLRANLAGSNQGLLLRLAVCHLIVRAHRGSLWMTHRTERNVGFHFTVPILREKRT